MGSIIPVLDSSSQLFNYEVSVLLSRFIPRCTVINGCHVLTLFSRIFQCKWRALCIQLLKDIPSLFFPPFNNSKFWYEIIFYFFIKCMKFVEICIFRIFCKIYCRIEIYRKHVTIKKKQKSTSRWIVKHVLT